MNTALNVPEDKTKSIEIFHSPDADDAFMFYGFACGAVSAPGITFHHGKSDIESLNRRALTGEVQVSAVSAHVFAYLKNRYVILRCGASMGGVDYGPRLVSKTQFTLNDGVVRTFALPGEFTSAALALRIFLKEQGIEARLINLDFEAIQTAVAKGEVDAGVVIHEGQITHRREGLFTVLDLGAWWWSETGLPLPLGINVIRKDLGTETIHAVQKALRASVDYALSHRKEAIEFAMTYGRGITPEEADTYISMYVNDWTVDLGARGMASIDLFFSKGRFHKLIPVDVAVEFAQ